MKIVVDAEATSKAIVPSTAKAERKSSIVPGIRMSPMLVSKAEKDELVNAPDVCRVAVELSVSDQLFASKFPSSNRPSLVSKAALTNSVDSAFGLVTLPDVPMTENAASTIVETWLSMAKLAPVGAPKVSCPHRPLPNRAVAILSYSHLEVREVPPSERP